MSRTRFGLLKKLRAVLAVALILHTQAAWACANLDALDADHEPAPPCCAGHSSMASDPMPECDDPSGKSLCAKPFAHSSDSALFQVRGDSHGDPDTRDDGGVHSAAPVALIARYPAVTDTHRPPRTSDPGETLAPARFTYLQTLRLRI